jgi:hypothetical protein
MFLLHVFGSCSLLQSCDKIWRNKVLEVVTSQTSKTGLALSDFSLNSLELIVKFIADGRVTVAQDGTFTPVEQKPSI